MKTVVIFVVGTFFALSAFSKKLEGARCSFTYYKSSADYIGSERLQLRVTKNGKASGQLADLNIAISDTSDTDYSVNFSHKDNLRNINTLRLSRLEGLINNMIFSHPTNSSFIIYHCSGIVPQSKRLKIKMKWKKLGQP